jgi:hypothetical protein
MLTDADVAAEHVTLLILLRHPEALETQLHQENLNLLILLYLPLNCLKRAE